jgi:F0F1-type ATP synthase membrane subunit b/b'
LPTVTDEECSRAAEAVKEFTDYLKTLKLATKQKDEIVSHAGLMIEQLITITKESKDREAKQKVEDDKSWLRNEIDEIIQKRLGSVSFEQKMRISWR